MSHLSNVWFSVTPLQVASGHGCWVTTTDGEEYLDFAAGIAVNSTGHAHPRVAKAIADQAQRFIHAQVNVFKHDLLEPLAAKLAELSPGGIDTFFYANSGAEITEASLSKAMALSHVPDPDLLIRTGGEMRISNFLLWQSAYTEFVFTDTLWPDFDAAELDRALAEFARRERRFGKTSEQLPQAQASAVADTRLHA